MIMIPRTEKIPHHWIEEIINLVGERIVVVDREGIILYINGAYCEFLGTTVEEAIGKPAQDVIENSRMHIVAKTGQKSWPPYSLLTAVK